MITIIENECNYMYKFITYFMHVLPFRKKLNHTSKLKVYGKAAMVHYCKSYLLHPRKPYAGTPSCSTLLPYLQSSDGVSISPSSPINAYVSNTLILGMSINE